MGLSLFFIAIKTVANRTTITRIHCKNSIDLSIILKIPLSIGIIAEK